METAARAMNQAQVKLLPLLSHVCVQCEENGATLLVSAVAAAVAVWNVMCFVASLASSSTPRSCSHRHSRLLPLLLPSSQARQSLVRLRPALASFASRCRACREDVQHSNQSRANTHRERERQTDRRTDRQTDRQTDREAERAYKCICLSLSM